MNYCIIARESQRWTASLAGRSGFSPNKKPSRWGTGGSEKSFAF
jgi:hypothetical protein